jgi:hypothetical protein
VTLTKSGFSLELLSLTGPGKPLAELAFADGLNIVTGASDTGKSYALGCIDYAFGASSPPRTIPQAEGYTRLALRIRARASGEVFEITRALAGGDVQLREFESSGSLRGERILGARHDPQNAETISGLLLGLSGLAGKHVRKNKQGDQRSLSFRDVAFLILVDEERIISERPPHISGSPQQRTVEGSVLRLLATGSESGNVIAAPKKLPAEAARAQLELVLQLEAQVTTEIERLGIVDAALEPEIARIEAVRNDSLATYEGARVELVEIERAIATASRALRDVDARALVVDGLGRRFELLGRHYGSDLSRLEAVEEAGTLLESFPATACPVCGAAPKDHRDSDAEVHFRLDDVRAAARGEATKLAALQADLSEVVRGLSTELVSLQTRREVLRTDVSALQAQINSELQPRMRSSAEALRTQTARRDVLLRARTLMEQRADLRRRAKDLDRSGKRGAPKTTIESAPTTGELEEFAAAVQDLLREWNYPDAGRVVFSEGEQDLVIGGQPRGSHGKGVRALSCAAFIAGLMRHCEGRQLPHPGVVLLDSPLVVYREPDTRPETQKLRQAGVKEAFYRSLAAGAAGGQIIIFENEDPPVDIQVNRHHFSKSTVGRYGFVPG